MLNPELLNTTPWHEFFGFFMKGNPPLIVWIVALNAVFLSLFLFRKAKAKHQLRASTSYAVQGLVVLANFAVIYHEQITQYVKTTSRLV